MNRQCCLLQIIASVLLLVSGNVFCQKDTLVRSSDSAISIFNTANGFVEHQQWDSAIFYAHLLNKVVKAESGEVSEKNAITFFGLGEIYRAAEKYDSSYYYFKAGKNLYEKISPHIVVWETYGLTLCRLGFACIYRGASEEAITYFEEAIAINDKAHNSDYVQMILAFAKIHLNRGDYRIADSCYSALNKTIDSLPQNSYAHYMRGALYNDIAILSIQIGSISKALGYLQKSLDMENIAKREGHPGADEDYLTEVLNLAEEYARLGFLDSALAKCREAEDSLKPGLAYINLLKVKSFIKQLQNKPNEAIDLLLKYKNILSLAAAKPNDYEANMINLAILYIETRQFKKAGALLKEQFTRLRRAGLEYSYLMQQSVTAYAASLIDLKQYDEAADTLTALCHRTFMVMNKNFPGMSESQKLQYEKDINVIFDLLYIIVRQNKNIGNNVISDIYQLELKRKALILNSMINLLDNARKSKDSAFLKIYRGWIGNRQILAKQYSLPFKVRSINVDSLENITETIEKKLSARSFLTQSDTGKQSYRHIGTKLNYSADVEFVRFDYKSGRAEIDSAFYIAFIGSSGDSVPVVVNLCSEKELLTIMQGDNGAWKDENQLTKTMYSADEPSGNAFYKLVWKPLEKYLTGIKIVNYTTSGLLNNISFQAIHDGRKYLVERFNLRRFFSLTDAFNKDQEFEKPEAASIWGNINYNMNAYNSGVTSGETNLDNEFPVMPATVRTTSINKGISREALQPLHTNEASKLKKIFSSNNIKVSSFEKATASEENFKQGAAGINGILHISTHGFYAPLDKNKTSALLPGNFIAGIENPLFRCGLAFSGVNYYWLKGFTKANHDDGILTGYEVAQLDLHNVQLVTLSACETGLGDVTNNEANIGLQRAFKLAGVHNLLVSLWQVPAKQTAELLTTFYTNWLHGQTLAKALQSAELAMKKKYPPYFWAGFVLIE